MPEFMNELTVSQSAVDSFNENGFIVFENALKNLDVWRDTFCKALSTRTDDEVFPDQERTKRVWGPEAGSAEKWEKRRRMFQRRYNLSHTNDTFANIVQDIGPILGRVAAQLNGLDAVRLWYEDVLIKPPRSDALGFHWDAEAWSFNSKKTVTCWMALDDVTYENGCMWFLPGSHKIVEAATDKAFTKQFKGSYGFMDTVFGSVPELKDIRPVPHTLRKGSLSFHTCFTVHASGPNFSPEPRRAFAMVLSPKDIRYNGNQHILTDKQCQTLEIGGLIDPQCETYPLLFGGSPASKL